MMNGSVFRRIIDVFSLTGSVVYFTWHFTGKVPYLMRSFCVQYFMRGCRVHALKCLLLDQSLIIDVIGIGVIDNNSIVVFLRLLIFDHSIRLLFLLLPLLLSLRLRCVSYICLLDLNDLRRGVRFGWGVGELRVSCGICGFVNFAPSRAVQGEGYQAG